MRLWNTLSCCILCFNVFSLAKSVSGIDSSWKPCKVTWFVCKINFLSVSYLKSKRVQLQKIKPYLELNVWNHYSHEPDNSSRFPPEAALFLHKQASLPFQCLRKQGFLLSFSPWSKSGPSEEIAFRGAALGRRGYASDARSHESRPNSMRRAEEDVLMDAPIFGQKIVRLRRQKYASILRAMLLLRITSRGTMSQSWIKNERCLREGISEIKTIFRLQKPSISAVVSESS